MNKLTGSLFVALGGVCLGTVPIWLRFAGDISPLQSAFARMGITVLFLAIAFVTVLRAQWKSLTESRSSMILLGLSNIWVTILYFFALTELPVALAVMLLYTGPLWVIGYKKFWLQQKLSGVVLGAAGVAVLGIGFLFIPELLKEQFDLSMLGIVAGIGAGMGFGTALVVAKKLDAYSSWAMVFWQNIIALAVLIPLLIVNNQMSLPVDSYGALLGLGVVGSLLGFGLLYQGIKVVSSESAGVLSLLELVTPVVLSWMIFGESLTWNGIVGGIFIVVATGLIGTSREA